MKHELIYLLLLPFLSIMMADDFRRREIEVIWLALFSVATIVVAAVMAGWHSLASNFAHNALLLAFMFTGAAIYLWIKVRALKLISKTATSRPEFPAGHEDDYTEGNTIRSCIGTGDILFLGAVAPLFALPEFLIFLIVSLLASLAGWGVYRLVAARSVTIPMVSTVGICLCCYLSIKALL